MTNKEAARILEQQKNKFLDELVDFGGVTEAYNKAIDLLNKQEPVYCKDCEMNKQCSIQFKFANADNQENWFCADGKRKIS